MKKISAVLAISLVITAFIKNEVQALVVGDEIIVGDVSPGIPVPKLQLGVVAEFVRDKNLNPDTGSEKMSFEGDTLLLKATFSPFENMDIYAKIGIGENKLTDSNHNVDIKSEIGPAYGGGVRANLKKWDDMGMHLGMDLQFLRFDAHIDAATIGGTRYSSAAGNFTVNQWQAAIFVAKEFFQVIGYVGIDYADSIIKYNYDTADNDSANKGKNDNIFGLIVGLNTPITDGTVVFVEGHLIDEESISLGLNLRF